MFLYYNGTQFTAIIIEKAGLATAVLMRQIVLFDDRNGDGLFSKILSHPVVP
jgi:hypothetical protein